VKQHIVEKHITVLMCVQSLSTAFLIFQTEVNKEKQAFCACSVQCDRVPVCGNEYQIKYKISVI
jgi:hypothetical protein